MAGETEQGKLSEFETQFRSDSLRLWLARGSELHPEKPYIVSVEDNRVLAYTDLKRATEQIAAYLASHDIGANDRVVLLANNSIEHLVVYLGVLAAGAAICTIHVEMNLGHLATIIPGLSPRLVLYEEGLAFESLALQTNALWLPLGRWKTCGGEGFFAEIARPMGVSASLAGSPIDDAVICFTSGTTARPKGVVLTYREMLANAAAIAEAFGMGSDDRVYDYRSFNWASAQLLGALATLSKGATLLLSRKFSRSRFFSDLERFGATIAAGNPTVINMLLQEPETTVRADLPRLRFITSSSAPLAAEEWRRFEDRFGISIVQGYGSTETGWIAGGTEKTKRFGAVGKPLPYQRLTIADRDGRRLAPGKIGHVEIGAFGDNVFRYIAENGEIHVSTTGRARTGDIGYLDADGYLFLTGREKDLIIRGGVNISPLEIDHILMQLPGIAEAATVGVPDRIYGEEVISFVVLKPGVQLMPDDILKSCAERIPAFKSPKQIILRASLPKTERGKLDRKGLVQEWNSMRAESA